MSTRKQPSDQQRGGTSSILRKGTYLFDGYPGRSGSQNILSMPHRGQSCPSTHAPTHRASTRTASRWSLLHRHSSFFFFFGQHGLSFILAIGTQQSHLHKGALKKKLHQQPQKKKGGRKRQCIYIYASTVRGLPQTSAISADVTHAVEVAHLAPATEHAEASLFAPFNAFAVVVAVFSPEARLFVPFGQLNLFLRL